MNVLPAEFQQFHSTSFHTLLCSQYDVVVVVYLLTFTLRTHVSLSDFKRGLVYTFQENKSFIV